MTAFIGKNATESIGFIKTDADAPLTKWAVDLGTEYISIPTSVYELSPCVISVRSFHDTPLFVI